MEISQKSWIFQFEPGANREKDFPGRKKEAVVEGEHKWLELWEGGGEPNVGLVRVVRGADFVGFLGGESVNGC